MLDILIIYLIIVYSVSLGIALGINIPRKRFDKLTKTYQKTTKTLYF